MNGLFGTSPVFGSAGSGFGSAKRSGVLGSSPRTGSAAGTSYGMGTSAPIAKFQHPSHALLENHGFKQIVYKKYYKRCLEERAQKGEYADYHDGDRSSSSVLMRLCFRC